MSAIRECRGTAEGGLHFGRGRGSDGVIKANDVFFPPINAFASM